MCGVFGYIGNNSEAAELVLQGLRTLEYRGYDSWGVVVAPAPGVHVKSELVVKKQAGKIGLAGVAELPKSRLGIGHTRWATHGGVTAMNSHPHLDCAGQIAIVHNGIIENYLKLKADLIKSGHKFKSETDSEVVAHLVEAGLNSGLELTEAVRWSFKQLTGQNAIVVIQNAQAGESELTKKIVAIRQGSPLVLGLGQRECFVSSDPSALLTHTKEVYFLADGELAEVFATGFIVKDVSSGKAKQIKTQILTADATSVELGDFQHFLQKEIFEQPKCLKTWVDLDKKKLAQIAGLADLIQASENVWLVACGSAGFASLAGEEFLATLANKSVSAVIASEFSQKLSLISSKSLVIGVSQSGETMDVLNTLKSAQKQGAKLAAIVNVAGSSLDRLVQTSVLLEVGPELAVATTKAFTSKIAIFLRLASHLAGKSKLSSKVIEQASQSVIGVLETKTYAKIQKLALKLKASQHVFVIGKGAGVAAAAEIALKLKETAYIHAEGLAAGELKHGSLALIEPGTPCIVLMTSENHKAALLSAAMELKARGGKVIGFGPNNQTEFDDYVPVANCDLANLIPQVVVGQILGYELALLKGIDPDKPRNLAKSVTVV